MTHHFGSGLRAKGTTPIAELNVVFYLAKGISSINNQLTVQMRKTTLVTNRESCSQSIQKCNRAEKHIWLSSVVLRPPNDLFTHTIRMHSITTYFTLVFGFVVFVFNKLNKNDAVIVPHQLDCCRKYGRFGYAIVIVGRFGWFRVGGIKQTVANSDCLVDSYSAICVY